MLPKNLQRVPLSESIASKATVGEKADIQRKQSFKSVSQLRYVEMCQERRRKHLKPPFQHPSVSQMLATQLHRESGILCSLQAEEGPELHPPKGQASRDSEQTLSI